MTVRIVIQPLDYLSITHVIFRHIKTIHTVHGVLTSFRWDKRDSEGLHTRYIDKSIFIQTMSSIFHVVQSEFFVQICNDIFHLTVLHVFTL